MSEAEDSALAQVQILSTKMVEIQSHLQQSNTKQTEISKTNKDLLEMLQLLSVTIMQIDQNFINSKDTKKALPAETQIFDTEDLSLKEVQDLVLITKEIESMLQHAATEKVQFCKTKIHLEKQEQVFSTVISNLTNSEDAELCFSVNNDFLESSAESISKGTLSKLKTLVYKMNELQLKVDQLKNTNQDLNKSKNDMESGYKEASSAIAQLSTKNNEEKNQLGEKRQRVSQNPTHDKPNAQLERLYENDGGEEESFQLSIKKPKLNVSTSGSNVLYIGNTVIGDCDKAPLLRDREQKPSPSADIPATDCIRQNQSSKSSTPTHISSLKQIIDLTDDETVMIPVCSASSTKVVEVFREVYMKGGAFEINKLPASTAGRPDYLKKRWNKIKAKDPFDGKPFAYGDRLLFRSKLDIQQLFSPCEAPAQSLTRSFSYMMQLVKNNLKPDSHIIFTDIMKDPYALETDGVFSHEDAIRFNNLATFSTCNPQMVDRLIIPTEHAFWDFDFKNETAAYYGTQKVKNQDYQIIALKALSIKFPEREHSIQEYFVKIGNRKNTVLLPTDVDPEQSSFVLSKFESVPENPCPLKVHNFYWQLLMVLMHLFGSTECRKELLEFGSMMKETDLINCLYGSVLRLYNLFTELPKILQHLQDEN